MKDRISGDFSYEYSKRKVIFVNRLIQKKMNQVKLDTRIFSDKKRIIT